MGKRARRIKDGELKRLLDEVEGFLCACEDLLERIFDRIPNDIFELLMKALTADNVEEAIENLCVARQLWRVIEHLVCAIEGERKGRRKDQDATRCRRSSR